jgi:hypothetical protein
MVITFITNITILNPHFLASWEVTDLRSNVVDRYLTLDQL